ncbi:hypothetical protein SF06_06590 [Pseudomonas flexibilis]|uniref:DUF1654 domain-containing protein n=1 Tax=Pseudomonas flexibilis TaxID=706570 RepID=A0A1N6VY02_9PSED|nr:DUF1654 domain-containing protein [Pseudomonas flexibilis]KHL70575.1 hypothetical protein SF06_06590 [Pseudomonas flexibilis]SIQ82739.1 Protein of unknown function [Pseudomonas flexibilis]
MSQHAVPLQTSYEHLFLRVLRQINRPSSQLQRRTVIERGPDESLDDWDQLLCMLEEDENVQVVRLDDGVVQLSWRNQHPTF